MERERLLRQKRKDEQPSPSRWNTPEFYFYYIVFIVILPIMCWGGHRISDESHPSYQQYRFLLTDGWIFGRNIDNSDIQYRGFRDNIPILFAVLCAYIPLSRLFHRWKWLPFSLVCSIIFITVIHGASVFKILSISTVNYLIAKFGRGSRFTPFLTWIFVIGILFFNEYYHGYQFSAIHPSLAWLDRYNGKMRWNVTFNITALRLISFNMDYYLSFHISRESIMKRHESCKAISTPENPYCCDKLRIELPQLSFDYNYLTYLAYLLYMPLFIAGPIISFNKWMSQVHHKPASITNISVIQYGIRLLFAVLVMEIMLHTFYVTAISKRKAWSGLSPFEISMVGYFNLKLIWLKLLVIWRFFRFWALADGIDPPENMKRCMSNNYSITEFWKNWHCSYNLWNVRYMYIPLGGSKYQMYNVWIIFTFVAVWHDIELRLLTWGWLICLFILPEIIAKKIFGGPQWEAWPYYRHLCALGGVLNIFTMMTANLVGFAVGVDGMADMLSKILNPSGIFFIVITIGSLFVAVQVMFEIREDEIRQRLIKTNL